MKANYQAAHDHLTQACKAIREGKTGEFYRQELMASLAIEGNYEYYIKRSQYHNIKPLWKQEKEVSYGC